MPKFKKSSGFQMKGYSYPGTSPMRQDFSKIQKIKEENWNKLSSEEKQKIKEFGKAYEASNQKKIDAYNKAKKDAEIKKKNKEFVEKHGPYVQGGIIGSGEMLPDLD